MASSSPEDCPISCRTSASPRVKSETMQQHLVSTDGSSIATTNFISCNFKGSVSTNMPGGDSTNSSIDESLLVDMRTYESSEPFSTDYLVPEQWAALVAVLLEKKQQEFDLKRYSRCDEGLATLLPVVKVCTKANLSGCDLTEKSCEGLASALRCYPSRLRELDLRDNSLQDAGVKLLSAGLGNPLCKLETLRLTNCGIGEEGCAFLVWALKSNPSHLRALDLSYNHPGHPEIKLLSDALENPHWALTTLCIDHCGEYWLLKKYACDLSLDQNTAECHVSLSEEGRRAWAGYVEYPDHPDRFEYHGQVLCKEPLMGRRYWEVEWGGRSVTLGAAYGRVTRKREEADGKRFEESDRCWLLEVSRERCMAYHGGRRETVSPPPSPPAASGRVGVYLDSAAGTLSFYGVSVETSRHLYTFRAAFAEPLYAAFLLPPFIRISKLGPEFVSLC